MRFLDRAHIARAQELLIGMAGRVPSLRDVEVHVDALKAPGAYDLCLITRFDDAAGLDAYQSDPVHLEAVSWLKTALDDRAIVDYET